jgi:hypothetical protein
MLSFESIFIAATSSFRSFVLTLLTFLGKHSTRMKQLSEFLTKPEEITALLHLYVSYRNLCSVELLAFAHNGVV